jgi:tmRNA-binding protein
MLKIWYFHFQQVAKILLIFKVKLSKLLELVGRVGIPVASVSMVWNAGDLKILLMISDLDLK